MKYMYYVGKTFITDYFLFTEAAWSVFVFLLVLIYFPAKPPLPPTVTASTERLDYKNGVKGLFRHKKFWLICFTYGISTGVFGCWQSVLDINLKPHGIPEFLLNFVIFDMNIESPLIETYKYCLEAPIFLWSLMYRVHEYFVLLQTEAGWLGLYAGLAGCVAAVIVANLFSLNTNLKDSYYYNHIPSYFRFNDVFSKHIRIFLLVAYIGAVAFFTWFTLILKGTLPDSTVSLYSSIIIATILISVVSPLYFEMACEATYPIAEGITNFVLTFINNVADDTKYSMTIILMFQIKYVVMVYPDEYHNFENISEKERYFSVIRHPSLAAN
ncbi:hypothetical protein KUTeg_024738 [Tegillarca granosa]|uniref:Uncharacterized protein n=1 Tax=Tegillarca granosa TaxID=220873 RepID=A0ABQ9DYX8_TEGGR|nr:hypothetical protein KUTeg_024738 [Tegillarca granosa]